MKLIVGSLAVWLAGWSWLPSSAQACSCSASAIDSTSPSDGATGVALNSALEVLGAFEPGSIALKDASGQAVEFTLKAGPTSGCLGTSAQLVPKQPLRPQTTYVLSVEALYPGSDSGPDSSTFTTGTASLPERDVDAPEGVASVVFEVPADGLSCGSGTVAACVNVASDENVEVFALRGDEPVLRWVLRGASGNDATFKLLEQPDCIELSRLTATGRRSAPSRICGEALRSRSFRASDRDTGFVSCTGGIIGQPAATTDAGPRGTRDAAEEHVEVSSAAAADDGLTPKGPTPVGSTESGCALASESARVPSAAWLAMIGLTWWATRRRAWRVR